MSSDICSSPTVLERPAASLSSWGDAHAPRRRITYVFMTAPFAVSVGLALRPLAAYRRNPLPFASDGLIGPVGGELQTVPSGGGADRVGEALLDVREAPH